LAEVVVEERSEGRMELGFLAGAMESRRTADLVVRLTVWVERKGKDVLDAGFGSSALRRVVVENGAEGCFCRRHCVHSDRKDAFGICVGIVVCWVMVLLLIGEDEDGG